MKYLICMVLLASCSIHGGHMGPHRLELLYLVDHDSLTYEVYGCYKYQCNFKDSIIKP